MSYTIESIRAEVAASPELRALLPDVSEIAKRLSIGRTKPQLRYGGAGAVMEALGAVQGAAILDAMQALAATQSHVKWAFKLLDRGELDFGSKATRESLIALRDGGLMPADVCAKLLAIGEVAETVDEGTVKEAVFNPNGTYAI